MTLTPWIFFIIGFPNPVFTDHHADFSVNPDSEREDKKSASVKKLGLTIIHDSDRVNIFLPDGIFFRG